MRPDTILIVEDTPATLGWLVSVVSEAFPETKVTTATTLQQGYLAVADHAFDFALVDLGLPDGSGLDLIKHIRKQFGPAPYIVVATIFDDDKHLLTALREGANGYLLKDEPHDTMVSHLRGVIENRPPMSTRSLDAVISSMNKPAGDEIPLTEREQDVLRLIAKGYNVTDAAEILGLTKNTVKSYLKTIYTKLGITSRAEATAEALRRNLIDL